MAIYAVIDRLDQQFGRILRYLGGTGEFENTLIFFTSDNGACFEWDPFGFDIKSGNQNILHKGKMLDEMGKAGRFPSVAPPGQYVEHPVASLKFQPRRRHRLPGIVTGLPD